MATAAPTTTHPLDPLDEGEILAAVAAVRATGRLPDTALFAMVTLVEPDRAQLTGFAAGQPVPRRARLVVLPRPDASLVEATVALPDGTVVDWVERDGVRPALLFDDSYRSILALKADPRWQAGHAQAGDHRRRERPDRPVAHRQLRQPRRERATRHPVPLLLPGRSRPTTATPGPSKASWPPWTPPAASSSRCTDSRGRAPPPGTRHLPLRRQRTGPGRSPPARDRPTRRASASPSTVTS